MMRPLDPIIIGNNHAQHPAIGNNHGPRSILTSLVLFLGGTAYMAFRSGRPQLQPDIGDYPHLWFFENRENLPEIAHWADAKVVHRAVRQNGLPLQYASEALRSNREVVLSAVRNYPLALRHASKALRSDLEVVLTAVKHDGLALKDASNALRSNQKVVLAAIRNNALALHYASEALRSNPNVVLVAMNSQYFSSFAITRASKGLRLDRDFMLKAVRKSSFSMQYAGEPLVLDRNFLLEAVRQNGRVFWNLPRDTRSDCHFILAVARNHPHALRLASKEQRSSQKKLHQFISSVQNGEVPGNQTSLDNDVREAQESYHAAQEALLMLRSVQQSLQSGSTQEAALRSNCSAPGLSRGYLRSNRYGLFAHSNLQTVHSREMSK